MTVLTQHRFTSREYHRMAEAGVLKPDARVELLDGQIIDMSPIGPAHGGVVRRLVRFFDGRSNGRWLQSVQDALALDEYSEPQPDLALLKPSPDDYSSRHPGPDEVLLLVEVADTSLGCDRGEKLAAYGRAGIPEVWIVNLAQRTVEVYREPKFEGYGSSTTSRPGDKISPRAFPDLVVDLAALLR